MTVLLTIAAALYGGCAVLWLWILHREARQPLAGPATLDEAIDEAITLANNTATRWGSGPTPVEDRPDWPPTPRENRTHP